MKVIRKRDAIRQQFRFHAVLLQPVLGLTEGVLRCDLVHEWGGIGSPGTVRVIPCVDADAAAVAADKLLRTKQRKGYR